MEPITIAVIVIMVVLFLVFVAVAVYMLCTGNSYYTPSPVCGVFSAAGAHRYGAREFGPIDTSTSLIDTTVNGGGNGGVGTTLDECIAIRKNEFDQRRAAGMPARDNASMLTNAIHSCMNSGF